MKISASGDDIPFPVSILSVNTMAMVATSRRRAFRELLLKNNADAGLTWSNFQSNGLDMFEL